MFITGNKLIKIKMLCTQGKSERSELSEIIYNNLKEVNIIIIIIMGRACSTYGEKRNAYRILVGKLERKRSLGRPRSRWVDNIKMDHREIGWDGVDWIDMAQDRNQWRALVNAVLNLRVP
jgi:hypothetical protein